MLAVRIQKDWRLVETVVYHCYSGKDIRNDRLVSQSCEMLKAYTEIDWIVRYNKRGYKSVDGRRSMAASATLDLVNPRGLNIAGLIAIVLCSCQSSLFAGCGSF